MVTKQEILERNIKRSGLSGITARTMRFPLREGVQQLVTLTSKEDGRYMNIGFVAGVENSINGYIADRLLDDFPGNFTITMVNGAVFKGNNKETERDTLKKEIMNELKDSFELVPKELRTHARQRTEEAKSSPVKKEETKKVDSTESL